MEYILEVTAPPGEAWTLWLPRPSLPTTVTVSPIAETVGEVQTTQGPMTVLSGGSGSTALLYRLDWSALRAASIEPEAIDFSGREGFSGYWVYRFSSSANASIEVAFSGHSEGRQWGDRYSCGGPHFSGAVRDGWNLVPAAFGDCVVILGPPPLISVIALGSVATSGGALVALGLRRTVRRTPFGGA